MHKVDLSFSRLIFTLAPSDINEKCMSAQVKLINYDIIFINHRLTKIYRQEHGDDDRNGDGDGDGVRNT